VAACRTLIVLDRQGRLVSKSEGALTREQIGQSLTLADERLTSCANRWPPRRVWGLTIF